MGTSIELELGGITLDYAKNHMGNDHGPLFQENDRQRRPSDEIDYEYFVENPDDELLARNEACFVRRLGQVIPRLNLLGHTIETAKEEYEAVVRDAIEVQRDSGQEGDGQIVYMNFQEFIEFCGRFDISDLDNIYIDGTTEDCDAIVRGRFSALREEIRRIPEDYNQRMYWSERSYFGSIVCILSPYSMLQVFGCSEKHHKAEVVWQFGPIVDAGWVAEDQFQGGAGRLNSILVATEGSSDARILRRAIDILHPDIADFFRFIDVDQSHPFPGTGNLVKFAEGLVRIDIQNRIIFVFDNDAEGLFAYSKVLTLQKPANMRAMMLPSIDSFKAFAARGPEGVRLSDINERAAAIECYLDLRIPGRPCAEVVWSNYKKEVDRWHGALEHKETYMRRFLDQSIESVLDGSYDTGKIRKIIEKLIEESIAMSAK
ncbi:HEPN/Toprim-associated domain-containing protein [Methylobacterium oryzae]|uniref:HEPN/Toprim-associated domain-containing protein n=1 Tax=Methylobacterium oryzae TaxID=334852 RepID=UPI002277FA76|nr:HEPN/Toprim-associated domain-containing protein [Methylobacterium oryzae]